ncbi:MAG: hypothetical protein LBO04_00825 [Spirochaetaceae bacterium]|nr:hypothetical protein [Spirochaetaceae bacterium]
MFFSVNSAKNVTVRIPSAAKTSYGVETPFNNSDTGTETGATPSVARAGITTAAGATLPTAISILASKRTKLPAACGG